MKSLKLKSAFLCTAAALAALGTAALSASAFEQVDLDARKDELKSGVVNIVADQVYAEPGEKVDFRVMLSGNTGYADSGIALFFDPALKVEMENEYWPVITQGYASRGLTMERAINYEESRVAYSTIGMRNCTYDGTDFTAYFTVPEDAKDGTVYPMRLEILSFLDNKTKAVAHSTVDGWITVRSKAVTTTTPVTTSTITTNTTPATTPAPVTSTTTVTKPPVTTPPVTNPPTETTSSDTKPVTNTTPEPVTSTETEPIVTTNTTEPVTEPITQKTTREINPHNTVTTAQGGTRPAGKSVKTGDAGIGAAAAGLLFAAGTAAALRKRKQDD